MTRHPEWLVPGALLVMTACGGETPSLHEPVRLADRVFDQAALTPVTFQDETRFSVAPNVPSQMRFEIRVPMRGVLEFGTGARVADGAVLPARVEFRVELRSGDEREMVFSHTIRRFEPNAWFDHEIDLTRWEGSVVDLSFEVSALAPRGDRDGTPASVDGLTPLWANPVIFSREAPRDRPDVILVSIDCLRVDHVSTYGYGCLCCLLLVMCTHPFAKKAFTLHLSRSEGHERYFGCNLMHRKALASSHQHLMAEAPDIGNQAARRCHSSRHEIRTLQESRAMLVKTSILVS